MEQQWFTFAVGLLDLILLSIALFIISAKLSWKKRWHAWIPGLRMFRLGESVGMRAEGIFCGIMDLLTLITLFCRLFISIGGLGVAFALTQLILFVFYFIYRLRVYIQLLRLFQMKKRWIILWLIANWIPLIIIGAGKKYQPTGNILLEEDWVAGEKPAELPAAEDSSFALSKEGLGIQINARTVRDFGKKRYLLKDIALNIPKKSLVLLLGGSGSGKTTMINAVIGYEKADATILLNGANVYKDYKKIKYKIGFVPQQNLIRGKDSVIRTIDDAAKIKLPKTVSKKERKQKISDVIDLLGLTSGQDGLVSKKSGGQLRRICIAMELATDPELFVLDEPDSGLDGVISREIFTKLRQIADEDRIVLVITHTPDRVIDLFDKVIVLARDSGKVGRLAFYGSPDEARSFFEKETMEQIVMSVNSIDEGGEGRADELIEKYAAYAAEKEGGQAS